MTAIEVDHLVKRYRSAAANAVGGISFTVPEGQLFCLLGPNGAGKTTTVSVLTTTLAPTSGRVRIADLDLATEQGKVRKELGVVFQQPSLDLNLTAEENIRLHAVLYGLYSWRPSYRLMPPATAAKYRTWLTFWISPISSGDASGPCPGGSGAGWRSSGRSCTGPPCCSLMSRPLALTRRAGAACGLTWRKPGWN